MLALFLPLSLFSKPEILKTVQLEENESVIISTISYVDISDDNSKLILVDRNSNISVQYGLNDGKILSSKGIHKELVYKFLEKHPKCYKYCSSRHPDKIFDFDTSLIGKEVPLTGTSYLIARYINDKIWIFTTIYAKAREVNNPKNKNVVMTSLTSIAIYDSTLSNLIDVKPPRKFKYTQLPTSGQFELLDNKIYVTSHNISTNHKDLIQDSLPTISEYDMDYNFIKHVAYLPDEMAECHFRSRYLLLNKNYRPYSTPMVPYGDDLIYTHYNYNKIHFVHSQDTIQLRGLPYLQAESYKKIDSIAKLNIDKHFSDEDYMEIMYSGLVRNRDVFVSNKNNIGIIGYELISLKEMPAGTPGDRRRNWHVQSYSKTGDLLYTEKIDLVNDNGKLEQMKYNKNDDTLILFRKHKQKGWTMEVMKWKE